MSWEYLFETKLQRAMAAEAEAAREARAKAIQVICFSLEVFLFLFLFFLFACICFVVFFVFVTSSFVIFFKLESMGKGDRGRLFLPLSFSFSFLLSFPMFVFFFFSSFFACICNPIVCLFLKAFPFLLVCFNLFVFPTSSFVQTREPGQKAIQVSSLREQMIFEGKIML